MTAMRKLFLIIAVFFLGMALAAAEGAFQTTLTLSLIFSTISLGL